MVKVAHISDVHLRINSRHDEYKQVFRRLFKKLKGQKVDHIAIAGDLVHSKITMSPELIDIMQFFLNGLRRIAPVHLIAGNHDLNMSNKDRMDALSPVVEAISKQKGRLHPLHYYKKTGVYDVEGTNISFVIWSMLDGKQPQIDKDPNRVYIGLYHGAVSGSKLDNDYSLLEADISVDAFKDCDITMLGDIHSRQGFGPQEKVEIEKVLTAEELESLKDQDGVEILDVAELEDDKDLQGSVS